MDDAPTKEKLHAVLVKCAAGYVLKNIRPALTSGPKGIETWHLLMTDDPASQDLRDALAATIRREKAAGDAAIRSAMATGDAAIRRAEAAGDTRAVRWISARMAKEENNLERFLPSMVTEPLRSPDGWIGQAIMSAEIGDTEALEGLKQARDWWTASSKPMPENLRTWQPSRKRGRRTTTVWRNRMLVGVIQFCSAKQAILPDELQLPIKRPIKRPTDPEERLSICDVVAQGWNLAWEQKHPESGRPIKEAANSSLEAAPIQYETVLTAWKRSSRRSWRARRQK